MLPEWKKQIINNMKSQINNGKKLSFIHTPKCGGTYASQYMTACNIENKKHKQATKNSNKVFFTIIRDPIKRFESLLNYRLGENHPRPDFSSKLIKHFYNKSHSLDNIIDSIKYKDINKFNPYNKLTYWSKNVDLLITIDELEESLTLLGYNVKDLNFDDLNVSKKERGTFNQNSINKLNSLFISS